MEHQRLTDMAACYGVRTGGAHRGLAGCRMTWKVYEGLFGKMTAAPKRRSGWTGAVVNGSLGDGRLSG